MNIIVLGSSESRAHFLGSLQADGLEFINDLSELKAHAPVDMLVDLDFHPHPERIQVLTNTQATIIAVNDVLQTVPAISNWFRFNGWRGFANRPSLEIAVGNNNLVDVCTRAFQQLGKTLKWVPDVPGFIAPRIVAMIINEAFLAWEENVSTKEEIDTAMKLGTNYPHGPFEWAEIIGHANLVALLQKLSLENPRYQPAPGLM